MAANGSTIVTFGQRSLSLRFGKKQFRWVFLIAEVTQPIIGADFLCAHSLMVDVNGCRLVNIENFETVRMEADSSPVPQVSHVVMK